MLFVGVAFPACHGVVFQFLAGFAEAWGGRVRTDRAVFQVFDPFVERGACDLVELVHADQDVFGEDLGRQAGNDGIAFAHVDTQEVAGMHANEMVLPVIEIVRSDTEVEIEDADGIHLLHFLVAFAQGDMLGDGLGYAVEDTFEIVYFAGVLYLDENDLPLAVERLDVDTVELVVGTSLVAFAFKDFDGLDLFVQHDGQETVEHVEVSLLPQQAFDGPIETDIPVLQLYSFFLCHDFRILIFHS